MTRAPVDGGAAVRRLAAVGHAELDGLAALLVRVVEDGASVGFMHPLAPADARAFWERVAAGVADGEVLLAVAEDARGVVGTVQLLLAQQPNQPHRAELAKMMVHPRARRHGIAGELLRAAETWAAELGRSLLVLDTATGSDAERLYARHGWTRCGVIPGYALMPRGGLSGTTILYRELPPGGVNPRSPSAPPGP